MDLDKQLFSGFFSALVDFSKSQFSADRVDYLKNINFMNSSFAISEIEKTLVIYRLEGQMNDKRFKQFLQPISEELNNIITNHPKLVHLKLSTKTLKSNVVSISLQDYDSIFDKELSYIIKEFQMNQHQLQTVDILSLVQLKNEFQDLLVKLGNRDSVSFVENSLESCSEITKTIINSNFPPNMEFPLIQGEFIKLTVIQNELIQIIEDFFKYATVNINKLVSKSNLENNTYILKFIKMNYLILKQFLLDEIFFKEFLRILPHLREEV